MKKIKRLFSILIMSLVALFVFASTNKAQAATTNEGINIEYKTYKASDYDNFVSNFEATYGATLVDVLSDLQTIDAAYYGLILSDGYYATEAELADAWDSDTYLGKKGTITYAQAVAARNAFYNLSETTSFVPEDEVVIVPYVKFCNTSSQDIGFTALTLYFNFKPKNASSWDWTNEDEMFSSATIEDAATFYSKTIRKVGLKSYPAIITSSTSAVAGAGSGLGNLGLYLAIGADTNLYGNFIAGATRVTLGSTLSGYYKISVNAVKSGSNTTYYDLNGYTNGEGSTKKITTSPALWSETEKIISVVGANSNTGIKNVTVGGTTLNSTNSTITHTNPSDLNAGQSTYAYNTGVSGNPVLGIELNSGTVTGVKWSNTSFTNAESGAPLTANADGTYTVDMSSINTGENIYLAVSVLATDGTTTRTHYVSIPKAKSNDALLNNLIVKDSTGATIDYANNATFNANTFAYTINIPETTSKIKVNADFDSIQTATITTNTVTNATLSDGSDYEISNSADLANGKKIIVTCTAQDGTTSKSYTITINQLSSNAILPSNPTVNANGTGTSVNITKTDPTASSNGKIEVTGIDYTGTSFTFTPVLADGQTAVITLGGSTYTPGSTYTFPTSSPVSYAANTVTGTVVVTAADGQTTKTYDVVITRSPADTDASITGITVSYTGGSKNVSSPVVGTNTVTGVPYGITSFDVAIALSDGKIKNVEIGSGNGFNSGQTSYSESGFTLSTGYSGVSTTVVITVKAEDQTVSKVYTLVVERNDANNDASITNVTVKYTGGTKTATPDASGNLTVSNVPYGITSFDVTVTLSDGSTKAVKIGDSNSQVTGQTSYTETGFTFPTGYSGIYAEENITVWAQDRDVSKIYKLTVNRDDANDDNTITNVTVSYTGQTGVTVTPDASGNMVVDNVPYTVNTFTVKVTLADGTLKTLYFDNVQQASSASYTLSNVAFPTGYENISKSIAIKVQSQDLSQAANVYNLTVKRLDASKANKLSSLVIENNEATSLGDFDVATQTFTSVAQQEAWIESYTFTATLAGDAQNADIKYYIRKGTETSRTQISSTTVAFSTYGNVTTLIIEIKAQNPNEVNTIEIPISRKTPDSNAAFTFIAKADVVYPNGATGADYTVSLNGPSSGTYTNSTTIIYDTKTVTLTVTPESEYTIVEIDGVKAARGQAAIGTVTFTSLLSEPKSLTVKIYTQNNYSSAADTKIFTFTRQAAQNDLELTKLDAVHPTTGDSATQKNSPANLVYSYIVKQSEFGNTFKIVAELAADSRSDIYVSTNINDFNDPTNMDSALLYNSSSSYNIGTTIYVGVVSEQKQKKIYTVKSEFTDERDTNNTISKIEVFDITDNKNVALTDKYSFGDGSNHAPSFTVPYGVKKIKYVVTLQSLSSTLAPGSKNTLATGNVWNYVQELSVGNGNTVSFVCTAENETPNSNPYDFTVTRSQGSSLKLMDNLVINGVDCKDSANITSGFILSTFNSFSNSFDIVFPRGTSMFNFDFTYSDGATMLAYVDGDSTQQFTSTPCCVSGNYNGSVMKFIVQITPEIGGIPGIYTINVYVADQEYTISDINILLQDQSAPMLNTSNPKAEFDFSASSTGTQTHNVAYKNNDNAYIEVVKATRSGNAVITGLASNCLLPLTAGQPNTIEITIKSEYASLNPNVTDQYKTYKITVNRAAANNNAYLEKLEIYLDGTLASFDDGATFIKENGNYTISEIPTPSTLEVVADTEDENATINGPVGNVEVSLVEGSNTVQFIVLTVTAEDGTTKKTYTVKLSLEVYVPSPVNTLNSLQAIAAEQDRIENFNNNQDLYNINVAATIDKIMIVAVKGNSLQTVMMECTADGYSSETLQHTFDLVAGQTKEIVVIVSPEDENAADRVFTINVTRANYDPDNTLKDLKFNGTTLSDFNSGKTEYKVYVTGDVTEGYLEATANSTLATIAPYNDASNKLALAVGENKFEVVVSAENGDPKTYTVYVYRDPSLYLNNLEVIVNGSNIIEGFVKEDTLYPATGEYTVNYSTTTAEFIATPEATGDDAGLLTITYAGQANNNVSLVEGSKSYVVRVTAPSKAYKDYTVVIKRQEGNSDAYITSYITEAGETLPLVIGTYEYRYRVDKTTSVYNPTVSFSTGAATTFDNVKNSSLTPGTVNSKTISVTSEDGKVTNTYIFYIYTASNDVTITDINVLDTIGGTDIVDLDGVTIVDYDKDTFTYTLNVPYSLANVYLEIISDAKLMVNNNAYTNSSQPLSVGDNKFEIYVVSEYGQLNPDATNTKSQKYTVNIVKEAPNSDASLKELVIKTANGTDLLIDLTSGNTVFVAGMVGLDSVGTKQYEKNYTIANIGNISSVSISYVATFNSTSVTPILTSGVVNWQLGDAVSGAGENSVFTFEKSIVCTATDGTIATYNITLMRGPLDPDEDNAVVDIKVKDSNGNSYLNNFAQGTEKYGPYEIPYGIQSYTITASKNEFTYAQLSCVNANDASDSGFEIRTIGADFYDADKLVEGKNYREIVYKVYATANKGNGAKGTEYLITLRFLAPSNDNTLGSIKVDGVDVPGYTPETTDYTLADIRTYTTLTAEFKVKPNEENAKVISINGVAPQAPVAGVYTQIVDLKVGTHVYKVIVQAQNGDIKEYNITIQRDSESPYLSDLAVDGQLLLNTKDESTVFNKGVFEYRVIVTFVTLNATIAASVDNVNYTMSCTNSSLNTTTSTFTTNYFDVTNLEVGENNFVITVRSTANKVTEYKLTIIRRNAASMNTDVGSIDIIEVPKFKDDYDDLKTVYDKETYAYTVPNKVVDLDVIVDLKNLETELSKGATYEIFNATNLKVGDNKVIILVTAEDGKTTKAIVVDVYRKEMEYEFDKTAYSQFEVTDLEKDEKGRARYQVNLNNKNASAIEDFTKYIKFDAASNNITVKEITDKNNSNRNEVVLEITDGDRTDQVVIQLNTTANNGNAVFDWGVWILLGVAIIILIIILIAVNRDKYGSVTNKRKKLD